MVRTDATAAPRAPSWSMDIVVTWEAVAYVALMGLAVVLRLVNLAWLPLDAREAGLALAAWRAAQGQAIGPVAGAPLLFQLQQWAFWLLTGGDAVARLVPALAGVLLVPAAAGLRPLMGRAAALAAAALFSLSPLWVFYGRNVSSSTLSALLAVLLLGLVAVGGRRAGLWLAIAAGLLITSGGVVFSLAVAGVLYWLVGRLQGRGGDLSERATALWPTVGDRRRAVIALVVTVVLAATGLLLRPEGFAALVQLPAQFLAEAATGSGPILGLVLPLVSYAPVTLMFGLAGLVVAWRGGTGFGRFVVIWLLVGWLVALLAAPATLPDMVLPLTLAAAFGLGTLATSLARSFQWREEGVMTTILLVVMIYTLYNAFTAISSAPGVEVAERQVLGGLAVAVALGAVYFFLWGAGTTLRVLGLTWLMVGGLLAWSGGSALNYRANMAQAELLRPTYVTPDGARLADDLVGAAGARSEDPSGLNVVADPTLKPWLAWRLRFLADGDAAAAGRAGPTKGQVKWSTPPQQTDADAVITAGSPAVAGQEPAFGPAPYMGREYRVAGTFVPSFVTRDAFDPWLFLRWLLWREPARDLTLGGNVQLDRASLYLKVDEGVNP
jgi:4-amino-4-deoxy-L-arabinose transferase-like glycosyltransferase